MAIKNPELEKFQYLAGKHCVPGCSKVEPELMGVEPIGLGNTRHFGRTSSLPNK
jgi:hypothetical protein